VKISFDTASLEANGIDAILLRTPEDWARTVTDQRRINRNPILHRGGVEPYEAEYPCLAIINGVRESGYSADQLNVTFIPNVEVLEADED
jgi:hypothetical protein